MSNWEDETAVFLRNVRTSGRPTVLFPVSSLLPPRPLPFSFQILCIADLFWLTLKCSVLEEILILFFFKLKQGLPEGSEASQRERRGNNPSE